MASPIVRRMSGSTSPATGSPSEIVSTPVDGVTVLGALSPSRASDFMACPLQYRFRTVDRLPEEPSPDALRGTVVHKVLEDLFDLPAADRTPERAADLLTPSWEALLEAAPEIAEMFTEDGAGPDVASWLVGCREVLDRYFTLEDPRRLEPAERELYVEALLESRLLLRGFVDRIDIAPNGMIRVVDYKGLATDTPLPTPDGWTTMGDVRIGDLLIGSDGHPTRVTRKSGVHRRPCYRLTFQDGSSVVSDNVHLWSVVTSRRQQQTALVLDTEALHRLHQRQVGEGRPHSLWIESGAPLDLPDIDHLPISPWLLGAWLGDGDTRGGRFTVGRGDAADMIALFKEHWPRNVRLREESTAWSVTLSRDEDRCTYGHSDFSPPTAGHPTRRCSREWEHSRMTRSNLCFSAELQRAGLRGHKHIPAVYFRAGLQQRVELLRGLMDTDGWWNKTRRRAGFTTTDDGLAGDVVHLLRTLGIHPAHFVKPYLNAVRPGKNWHVIEFTPGPFSPFSLPRKALACADQVSVLRSSLARRRIISAIDPVPSVPTQCVEVDAPDSLYLCGDGFVPTHNTGKSPGELYEAKALFQMKFYALVIWRTRGVLPSVLQLVYLGNAEILRYEPDEADLLATERKVEAIWRAIRLCEETGDWQPSPSRLCSWCSFQALCPAFGGTPPPLPVIPVPAVDVDPAGEVATVQEATGRP